jgi:ferritin-like metal-binding protein YciE
MESEDKLDLILRRMEEFERRRVEADQRRRAEYQSLKAAVESWMPEIHKNAEDLQILVGDEQSKVTPTTCST